MVPLHGAVDRDPWENTTEFAEQRLDDQPVSNARYSELPSECSKKTSWKSWGATLKSFLYREQRFALHYSQDLKEYSRPDDREGDFLARIRQVARERRDLEVAKLRKSYESKFETLSDRIRRAENRVAEEREQANSATMSAAVSIGTSILGALFGRKRLSSTNVSRMGTSMRSASRAADQRSDIQRAEGEVDELDQDVEDLKADLDAAVKEITEQYSAEQIEITPYEIKPRKSDLSVESLVLLWLPYQIRDGIAEPAYEETVAAK